MAGCVRRRSCPLTVTARRLTLLWLASVMSFTSAVRLVEGLFVVALSGSVQLHLLVRCMPHSFCVNSNAAIEAVAGAVSLYGCTVNGNHVAILCKESVSVLISNRLDLLPILLQSLL